MDVIKPLISTLITEQCYTNYFVDFNFLDARCFKTLITKALGYGIVLGSLLVKVPQIQKIIKAGSGEGLSFISLLMELYAYISMFAYGYAQSFPFSSYGDSLFVMFQTLIIIVLFLSYNGQTTSAGVFVAVFGVILFILTNGSTPISIITSMQAINLPIVIVAKSMQIISNFNNGSTGQLSFITILLLFLGSLARIFTSIQETGDNMIILSFILSSLLNGIILAQILWYWNSIKSLKKSD